MVYVGMLDLTPLTLAVLLIWQHQAYKEKAIKTESK